jgi:hypothetical protein
VPKHLVRHPHLDDGAAGIAEEGPVVVSDDLEVDLVGLADVPPVR